MRHSKKAYERKERIAEQIRAKEDPASARYQIGIWRERLFSVALRKLQRQRKIRFFVSPGRLSYADMEEATDFYVVVINSASYGVHRLTVCGPQLLEIHMREHPKRKHIPVFGNETIRVIEHRLLSALCLTRRAPV